MEFGRSGTNDPGEAGHHDVRIVIVDVRRPKISPLSSKLWLSFHGIKGSSHLGQAELYPDYWNFKIILGKGQHIFNKVLKGCLYLIKSHSTTKSNLRTERLFEPKMLRGPYPSYFMEFGRPGTNDPGEVGHQDVRILL